MSQHSFSKSKIKVVLLEGIHQRAQQQFSDAGYENVMHDSSSLKGQDLDEALDLRQLQVLDVVDNVGL